MGLGGQVDGEAVVTGVCQLGQGTLVVAGHEQVVQVLADDLSGLHVAQRLGGVARAACNMAQDLRPAGRLKDELQAFIDQVVKQDDFDIVLTGAGTSEFVGNSLFQALNPSITKRSSPTLLPTLCPLPRISSPAPSPPCW